MLKRASGMQLVKKYVWAAVLGICLYAVEARAFSYTGLCYFKDDDVTVNHRCEAVIEQIVKFRRYASIQQSSMSPRFDPWLNPELAQKMLLTISGHADDAGSDQHNDRLSLQRASAVAAALEKRGFRVLTMRVKAYGRERPMAENNPAQNRRVEIALW